MVINKNNPTLYILELKRSLDRNKDFLGVKEDEANEQHTSIIEALKAAAPERTVVTDKFCGREACHDAAMEDDFQNKLERLNAQAGKKDKILAAHAQRICEAHDTII